MPMFFRINEQPHLVADHINHLQMKKALIGIQSGVILRPHVELIITMNRFPANKT